MPKVLVIGSNGMLGSTITKYFYLQSVEVTEANRNGSPVIRENSFINFDIFKDPLETLRPVNSNFDFVLNCSGLIKHKIVEGEKAMVVNGEFPQQLASMFGRSARIIQIATDCVFSGKGLNYTEASEKDATDVYGVSKIAGEVQSNNFLNLRTSVIGLEIEAKIELLEWVIKAPAGEVLNGFTNHFWNGITTLAFAKVILGIIRSGNFEAGTLHLIPANSTSKAELIRLIALNFNRNDLTILDTLGPQSIDRTLSTLHPNKNKRLWADAGYLKIPTIEDMIREYAEWTGVNK